MNLVALDGTKLIVMMAAGGMFALAGLWLMFRPQPTGGATKLELLGVKFEASSAGLLVFLIGSGFLATPLIVPERPVRPGPVEDSAAGPRDNSAQTSDRSETGSGAPASHENETEPNNSGEEAQALGPGRLTGRVGGGDQEDWFIFTPDASKGARFQVDVKALKGMVGVNLMDADGGGEGSAGVHDSQFSPETFIVPSISAPYYVQIKSMQGGTNAYELVLRYP